MPHTEGALLNTYFWRRSFATKPFKCKLLFKEGKRNT